MFLIIKDKAQIEKCRMKNGGHYDCLKKKNCPLKLCTMIRNTFNIRRAR